MQFRDLLALKAYTDINDIYVWGDKRKRESYLEAIQEWEDCGRGWTPRVKRRVLAEAFLKDARGEPREGIGEELENLLRANNIPLRTTILSMVVNYRIVYRGFSKEFAQCTPHYDKNFRSILAGQCTRLVIEMNSKGLGSTESMNFLQSEMRMKQRIYKINFTGEEAIAEVFNRQSTIRQVRKYFEDVYIK